MLLLLDYLIGYIRDVSARRTITTMSGRFGGRKRFLLVRQTLLLCQVALQKTCPIQALSIPTKHSPIRSYSKDSSFPWRFAITHTFPPLDSTANATTLLEYLWSPQRYAFSSASQTRRAIKHGEVAILPPTATFNPRQPFPDRPTKSSSPVTANDTVHRVTRLPCTDSYPITVTKYVYPPMSALNHCNHDFVVYENEELAVVNKPESMTTIGSNDDNKDSREDLQSLLPFLLHPPPAKPSSRRSSSVHQVMTPRPIHRLDRGTSGLILAAKTPSAMRRFSALFGERRIHKTYTAIVYGVPQSSTRTNKNGFTIPSGVVDYPIDGKPAQTFWRLVQTNGTFSQLELHPQTGRYHQLRRHLAYCLKTPIVGDCKYDLVNVGSTTVTAAADRKQYRALGLHLCCQALEFEYPCSPDRPVTLEETNENGRCFISREKKSNVGKESCGENEAIDEVWKMRISIDLPDKFRSLFHDERGSARRAT